MSVTRCDLRVLVRFDDGTIGAYAVDRIASAARLRDELGLVADITGGRYYDPCGLHDGDDDQLVAMDERDDEDTTP